ncbi:FHA domain-containing protein [Gymnodinialimonas hymeniacidonis]|uniref:FHA domain-containing protein n=1 Tax=Gymnodinialimonas hymeniacidonis TaxID=3126508 RepID=UPI0034C5FB44
MSIKRLRNVAVRMRPPASVEEPTAGARTSHPVSQPPAKPRRVAISRPRTDQPRQIWDLEADTAKVAPVPARSEIPAPASQDAQPPDRAKTRVIGFLGAGPGSEAASEVSTDGPTYPAGFLVVIDGPGRGAFFPVTTRVSSIGRGDDQDISMNFGDESISRAGHASIMYDAEQNRFFLGHGNKANAVRRNDMPVLATEEIQHGDTIRIGKTTLRFHAFCDSGFTWNESGDD